MDGLARQLPRVGKILFHRRFGETVGQPTAVGQLYGCEQRCSHGGVSIQNERCRYTKIQVNLKVKRYENRRTRGKNRPRTVCHPLLRAERLAARTGAQSQRLSRLLRAGHWALAHGSV